MKFQTSHERKICVALLLCFSLFILSCQKKEAQVTLKASAQKDTIPDFFHYKEKKAQVLLMGVFHFQDIWKVI